MANVRKSQVGPKVDTAQPNLYLLSITLILRFVPADISLGDCVVGRLADCGVVAGVAALAKNKELFEKVVPAGQGFDNDTYAGVFHFR